MVATRKSKVLPEPVSATDSADADSEETQNFNYERKQGLSRLRLGKSTDIENVRVWPLCFAIAIEKSRRIRPGIMVASSSDKCPPEVIAAFQFIQEVIKMAKRGEKFCF